MEAVSFIFSIAILIMSVVLHELSHGYAAVALGDPTPRIQGRLSLNPLKHLDPMGSVVLPIMLYVLTHGQTVFGWAKPVEWNPYNIKNRRTGELLIAASGPACNMLIATVFSIVVRYAPVSPAFMEISQYVVLINIVLAVFNLVPLPPLDGSKILFSLLPPRLNYVRAFIERYSYVFLLVALFLVWPIVSPIIYVIFNAMIGL